MDDFIRYEDLMNEEKIKMICPNCGNVREIPKTLSKMIEIDGVKCSPCFHERSIFVNLVLTKFEMDRINEKG